MIGPRMRNLKMKKIFPFLETIKLLLIIPSNIGILQDYKIKK